MKIEPSLNKAKLKQKIKDEYNILIESFKFVPEGEFASSYIITSEENEKYFLKMYFPSRQRNSKIHQLDFSLEIAYQLYNNQGIKNVSYPIKTLKGKLKVQFEEADLTLWNFIEGKIVSAKKNKTDVFAEKLGILLATIHNTTLKLEIKNENIMKFNISFREDLLLCLKEITVCNRSTDRIFLRLKDMVTPLMNNILEALNYLEELSQKLELVTPIDYVICHTDPIRHNILVDKNGDIHLVDWDNVMLAPFEQDIWFYLNSRNLPPFKQAYKKLRKTNKLNEDIIIFLFYERVLADFTDWIYRILFEKTNQKQVKSDFKGLDDDIVPVLPKMKELEKQLREKTKEW